MGTRLSDSPSSLLSPALDVLRTAEVEFRRQNVQLHEGGDHMTVICSNNKSRLAGCLAVRPKSQDCLSVWYYNICMLHLSTMSYSHFPHVIVYTWSASTSSCSFNTLGTAIKSQVEHCVCGVDGRMKEEGEMFKCPQKISPQSSPTFPWHIAYMFLILLHALYRSCYNTFLWALMCA